MSLFITDNYDDHVRFVSQVENGSKLDEGQLGDELPPPPTYEAIRCSEPQALLTRHLSPDPVQDSPSQCQIRPGQDSQGTQGELSELVCFGMLRDIRVEINPALDTYSLSFDRSFGLPDTFASLALSLQWNRSDFLSKQGISLAKLNPETHRQLSSISVEEDPIWLGVMPMDELQQRLGVVTKISSSSSPSSSSSSSSSSANCSSSMGTCTMDILVIGPLAIEDALARELGQHRLYLDHPDPMPKQFKYYNPQWFYTEGTLFYEPLVTPPPPETADRNEMNGSDNESEVTGEDKDEGKQRRRRERRRERRHGVHQVVSASYAKPPRTRCANTRHQTSDFTSDGEEDILSKVHWHSPLILDEDQGRFS
ncbi:hypothetical protein CBS147323_7830 [Aspergillus niger]|nr:hypothetical protein CBS147323_7830 [Aspergillus niger]